MVMVLLFLGVVFLLVGFQAMGSGGDSDGEESVATAITTTTTTSEAPPPADPARADVRVYNISEVEGAAEGTATRLRDAGWNVTETGDLTLEGVTGHDRVLRRRPG